MTSLSKARIPPFDIDAERSVLGSVLVDEKNIYECIRRLEDDDFYDLKNRLIYRACVELAGNNINIDYLAIKNVLESMGKLIEAGGISYIAGIGDDNFTSTNLNNYITILLEKSRLRKLIVLGNDITASGFDNKSSSEKIVIDSINDLYKIGNVHESYTNLISDGIDEMMQCHQDLFKAGNVETKGLKTGYPFFDSITGGLFRSKLSILAARPSIGKTSLALNMASYIAQKLNVLFISMETTREDLLERLISGQAFVDGKQFKLGFKDKRQFEKIDKIIDKVKGLNLWVHDNFWLTIDQLMATTREFKQKEGIALVVIDYLQLLRDSKNKPNTRAEEIAVYTSILKKLASELDIAILLLSQLSRAVEKRDFQEPQLSDLRDSGAIEQDADLVAFLYDPNAKKKSFAEDSDTLSLNPARIDNPRDIMVKIAKNRDGSKAKYKMRFLPTYTMFDESYISHEINNGDKPEGYEPDEEPPF